MTRADHQPFTNAEILRLADDRAMQRAAAELGIYLPASVLMHRADHHELLECARELGLELRKGF